MTAIIRTHAEDREDREGREDREDLNGPFRRL